MCRRVECGADKDAIMQRLLASEHSSAAKSNGKDSAASQHGISVYIGDSPSDLLPLVRADVGIVIGKSSSLRRVAAMAGLQLRPLLEGGFVCATLLHPTHTLEPEGFS